MKGLRYGIVSSFLVGMLCGCSVLTKEPYREIHRYDLEMPEARMALEARLPDVVINLTPAGQKMLFRTADLQLVEDPYLLWAQSPEGMLRRYFYCRFNEDPGKPLLRLTILEFELDVIAGVAELSVAAEIRNQRKILRSQSPLPKASGAAAAAAMSQCCAQCADLLVEWMNEKK